MSALFIQSIWFILLALIQHNMVLVLAMSQVPIHILTEGLEIDVSIPVELSLRQNHLLLGDVINQIHFTISVRAFIVVLLSIDVKSLAETVLNHLSISLFGNTFDNVSLWVEELVLLGVWVVAQVQVLLTLVDDVPVCRLDTLLLNLRWFDVRVGVVFQ